MDDRVTNVVLLPVCNCGYVFRNGITVIRYISNLEKTMLKCKEESIEPPFCPSCQRLIENIEYNKEIIYLEEHELKV